MVFSRAGLLVGTEWTLQQIVFIVVSKANDSTKYKQWILTCKIQGAPHIGSWAAPACQCSVQMFTGWWMHWCHEKKMKYEQKWKLTTGTSQSENFSHDLNVQQVHTWTVLVPNFATAMYTSSWQTRFLDKVLQMLLQQKQQLQNQLKMLRFGAKRHRRMWSLKLRKSCIILFIYLELQSDRTETSVEYQSKNYCEGSNWCRGILWCYSGFKLKNVLYVENNNAQEVFPIFCNISFFERQLKNI